MLVMLTVCLQTVNITSMTNTYCCVYSVETPDDGQWICLKRRVLCQNEFVKRCISLAFIIRMYHDAQPSECQINYHATWCHNPGDYSHSFHHLNLGIWVLLNMFTIDDDY